MDELNGDNNRETYREKRCGEEVWSVFSTLKSTSVVLFGSVDISEDAISRVRSRVDECVTY